MAFLSFVAMFLGPFYHLLPGFSQQERKQMGKITGFSS
jgi:hypothetical protein